MLSLDASLVRLPLQLVGRGQHRYHKMPRGDLSGVNPTKVGIHHGTGPPGDSIEIELRIRSKHVVECVRPYARQAVRSSCHHTAHELQ
mmetsp:Transcript_3084/g.10559  ORF Transcript_3084/g.10559 Transcript_3084/m.10559 type:complete len:88 (+) Transcript_3084:3914-4177(+)